MYAFTDKTGITWEIELTIGIMEEVKDKLEIDLLEPFQDEASVIADISPINAEGTRKFCGLIYLLCSEQCKKENISPEEFGRHMSPEALRDAYTAFFKEWQSFFQILGRTDLTEAISKARSLITEGMGRIVEEIKKINLDTLSGESSTNSQEQLESTQDHLP